MILKTSNTNMPKNYRSLHLAFRLKYFLDNIVIPYFFKHNILARDVTMGIIDKERMVLKYKGEDLGMITMSGCDLTFVKK